MTNIIFTNPEYRRMAFKRSGIKNLHPFDKQLRRKIIREYEDLPFDPDSLVAPSSLHIIPHPYRPVPPNPPTLHDVACSVLRNQFVDIGDPDHLALIRLDGLVLMKLVAILASARYRIEFRLPNFIHTNRKLAWVQPTLQEQIDFLNQYIPLVNLTRPPLRTYEEIVELSTAP